MFLPKRARPPFQIAVFMPGANAVDLRNSRAEVGSRRPASSSEAEERSCCPSIAGPMNVRRLNSGATPPGTRARFATTQSIWYKDLARTVDYLETRPDIAADKLAYIGVSRGAALAPVFLAVEHRIKAAALYIPGSTLDRLPPEMDVLNFAPRMKIPVLSSTAGTISSSPKKHRRSCFLRRSALRRMTSAESCTDTGHNLPRNEMITETLDWLDKYLGPVK